MVFINKSCSHPIYLGRHYSLSLLFAWCIHKCSFMQVKINKNTVGSLYLQALHPQFNQQQLRKIILLSRTIYLGL